MDWDNEYARLARLASQLRTSGGSVRSTVVATPTNQQVDLQPDLARLESQLAFLGLSQAESQRRRRLVQLLQQGNTNVGNNSYTTPTFTAVTNPSQPPQPMSQMQMAMRQQDGLIDELSIGVERLKDQTLLISDEAQMHMNLLGAMEQNLDMAHSGLETETRRAARLMEDQSVWRLQLIVAGLSVLLVLLIIMGF